jgi:hypothetical protein
MRYFGMTRDRSFDGLTDAGDLRALVERAFQSDIPSSFFNSGSESFRDFCEK